MHVHSGAGIFFHHKKAPRNLKKKCKMGKSELVFGRFFHLQVVFGSNFGHVFFSTLFFLGDFGGKLGVSVLVWYPAMPEQVSSDMTDEDEEALSKVNEVCLIFYTAEAGAFTRILIVERGD